MTIKPKKLENLNWGFFGFQNLVEILKFVLGFFWFFLEFPGLVPKFPGLVPTFPGLMPKLLG